MIFIYYSTASHPRNGIKFQKTYCVPISSESSKTSKEPKLDISLKKIDSHETLGNRDRKPKETKLEFENDGVKKFAYFGEKEYKAAIETLEATLDYFTILDDVTHEFIIFENIERLEELSH